MKNETQPQRAKRISEGLQAKLAIKEQRKTDRANNLTFYPADGNVAAGIANRNGKDIAEIFDDSFGPMMSAAPELLAIAHSYVQLGESLDWDADEDSTLREALNFARATIAKAEGGGK